MISIIIIIITIIMTIIIIIIFFSNFRIKYRQNSIFFCSKHSSFFLRKFFFIQETQLQLHVKMIFHFLFFCTQKKFSDCSFSLGVDSMYLFLLLLSPIKQNRSIHKVAQTRDAMIRGLMIC